MNNDWTDRLRDRMADYEMPVGDELWANIEQSLAQDGVFANKNVHSNHGVARSIVMRRFSIAASIAALLAGSAYVYFHPWNEVAEKKLLLYLTKVPKLSLIKARQQSLKIVRQQSLIIVRNQSLLMVKMRCLKMDCKLCLEADRQGTTFLLNLIL